MAVSGSERGCAWPCPRDPWIWAQSVAWKAAKKEAWNAQEDYKKNQAPPLSGVLQLQSMNE